MFLLHSLQSPINIGMILRTAEAFEHEVIILDCHGVMTEEMLSTVSDFSCGALERKPPAIFDSIDLCINRVAGRLIATSASRTAVPIRDFAFRRSDCIVVGNEYDGLSDEILMSFDAQVCVPVPAGVLFKPLSNSPIDALRQAPVSRNGQACLNVGAVVAIIANEIHAAEEALE